MSDFLSNLAKPLMMSLIVCLGLALAPSAAHAGGSANLAVARVATEALNVRAGPGTGYGILTQVPRDYRMIVLGSSGDWVRVRLDSGSSGWVAGWLVSLTALTPSDFAVGSLAQEAVVTAKQASVRTQPFGGLDPVAYAAAGTRMPVLDGGQGFWRVRMPSGMVGWVPGTEVKVYNLTTFAESVDYSVGPQAWGISQLPLGEVTDEPVNIRSGPGMGYRIVGTLHRGTVAKVRSRQDGWYAVRTSGGLDGWVWGSYFRVRRSPAVSSVILRQASNGSKVLSVVGDFDQPAIIQEFPAGQSLAVYLGVRANPGLMRVNAADLATFSLNDQGVLLNFQERPFYRVLNNSPGQVQIELSSSLDGVELAEKSDRSVVTLRTSGFVQPQAAYDPATGTVKIRLRGATYRGSGALAAGRLVRGMAVQTADEGLLVTINSAAGGRYLLRRSTNRLSVEFFPPGLAGRMIVLDPGHGGVDPGARGVSSLVVEKNVNLELALRLKPVLEQAGARVLLTRVTDAEAAPVANLQGLSGYERTLRELQARTELANDQQADLYLSIHNNSGPSGHQSGTTTYYCNDALNVDRSKVLAGLVQKELVAGLDSVDNGVRAEDFYVIRHAQPPSVLAEILFLSNASDEARLARSADLDRIVQALYRSIVSFFN